MGDFRIDSDPQIERVLNAAICQFGKETYEDIEDLISPATFTLNHNQVVFKCLKEIYTKSETQDNVKIDVSLLLSTAKSLGYGDIFQNPQERKLLDSLFVLPVEKTNARRFAIKIRKFEIRRMLTQQLEMATEIVKSADENQTLDEIISQVEGKVLDFSSLLNDNNSETKLVSENIDEFIDHKINNQCNTLGISTGYPVFDKSLGGGLRKRSIALIGGRAKSGKSFMSTNVGLHISRKLNINVLYIDTEMTLNDQLPRILANLSSVPINEIETGKFAQNKIQKSKVLAAKEELKKIPFYHLSVAGKPFEEIFSLMRRWVTKTVGYDEDGNMKNAVIIFDYIKLMDSSSINKNLQEYQSLGFLMHSLQAFVVKYDVACLALSQLNRDGVNNASVESISGSDRILWVASSFSIYKKKMDEDIAEDECGLQNGSHKLIPLISRYGEGLDPQNYINMNFQGNIGRITEGKTFFEVKANEKNKNEEFNGLDEGRNDHG